MTSYERNREAEGTVAQQPMYAYAPTYGAVADDQGKNPYESKNPYEKDDEDALYDESGRDPRTQEVREAIHTLEKGVRNKFAAKVFGIVGIMLAVTFGMNLYYGDKLDRTLLAGKGVFCTETHASAKKLKSSENPEEQAKGRALLALYDSCHDSHWGSEIGSRNIMKDGCWMGETFFKPGMTWGIYLFTLVLLIVMICNQSLMHRKPLNYILLSTWTLGFSWVVTALLLPFTTPSLVLSWGVVMLMSFALGLYAYHTKDDFTGCGMYLFAILASMMLFSLLFGVMAVCFQVQWVLDNANLIDLCFAYGFVALFSLYLVYDVQMIVGGKHERSNQFGVDDYIIAAINLYLDIINMLLYLIRIIGESS